MGGRRRIMFLDFDGCCNSHEEGSYVTNPNETYGPSRTICNRLREFCEKNGVEIVITSNWRKFKDDGWYSFDGNAVRNPLGKLRDELGDLITGTLAPERHISKSKCLILWFEDNGNDMDYVVFDDDPREGFQNTTDYGMREHFIRTDGTVGITDSDLERAGTILHIHGD